MEGPHSNRTPQRHEAWYALTATVMKTIEYPLLALTLTKEQCTHMPVLMSGLPACGNCRYFPRDVLYAPIKFQGVGLNNIYITMGLLRVDLIASEGKATTACIRSPPLANLLESSRVSRRPKRRHPYVRTALQPSQCLYNPYNSYHFGRYCDGGREIHHARSEA